MDKQNDRYQNNDQKNKQPQKNDQKQQVIQTPRH